MCGLRGARRISAIPTAALAQSEGLKVHGHWVIEVRNPDGSLASHHEFNNALAPGGFGGASLLAHLLGGKKSPGTWLVEVSGEGAPGTGTRDHPCAAPATTPPFSMPCQINQPGLTVSVSQETGVIELAGSFTVRNSDPIVSPTVGRVGTWLMNCTSGVAPATCAAQGFGVPGGAERWPFTSHVLATAIPVRFNQIVQVTVTITFS